MEILAPVLNKPVLKKCGLLRPDFRVNSPKLKTPQSMAKANKDFVIGFITRQKLLDDPVFLNLTPGVKMAAGDDNLGQQYITPHDTIVNRGSDIIIVGRGIYAETDPQQAAAKYRKAGWDAYEERSF